jgi:MFS family permease
LLWIGQTVSSIGNQITNVAIPFQLLVLGASPLQLGLTVALQEVTAVAFLLLGGVVADRIPRRTLILASDLVGGIVLSVVAALSAAGQLRIEHVYVAAVALGAADAFLSPAFAAIIAELVPADILRAGNAARLLGRSVARIAGPTIGGLVFALAGPAPAFAIDAFTFLFSFGTLLLARPARRAVIHTGSIVREIREGFGYVFSVRWLWTTTLYFMAGNVAFAGQSGVMTPLLVHDTLGGDARVYGLIVAAYGVGTIASSIGIAQLVTRHPGRVMFAFEGLSAVAVLTLGLVPILPVVVVSMAVIGVCLSASTVIWEALLQRHVPERMLGRVSSINLLGNSLINPLGPILAAAVIGAVGPPSTFALAGAYMLALVIIVAIKSPLRNLEEPAPTAA